MSNSTLGEGVIKTAVILQNLYLYKLNYIIQVQVIIYYTQNMLHVALFQPEIPPNTGNIMRLCANIGAKLHLIHPLGFILDDKRLRRAGLDYQEWTDVTHYNNYDEFALQHAKRRIFACTTKTKQSYHQVSYQDEDMLLFGPETRGLPEAIRQSYQPICIPMHPHSRSLNLSNAVAVIVFEAWRQLDFK